MSRARWAVSVLMVLSVCGRAGAQAPGVAPSSFESGVSGSAVSNGYGNWSALYARAAWQVTPSMVLFPEVSTSRQFHDRGTLVALGATQAVTDDWYLFGAALTSAGGFYLPRWRGTATANRKLLAARRLVLNAGASYTQWKDAHSDVGVAAGGAYYFTVPLIIEAGVSRNVSRPGDVASHSVFATATEGSAGSHYFILRVGGGREAYAVLAAGNPISDFASRGVSLAWRKWATRDAGFVVSADRYENPYYHRTGVALGAFWNIE